MAIKYRIEYEGYSKYPKSTVIKKLIPYLLPILLCITLVHIFLYFDPEAHLFDLLLPGDSAVTVHAFERLSESIGRGDTLPQALEIFCNTVINAQ